MSDRYVTADPERFALPKPYVILDDPRIERTDSCWLWNGSRVAGGYGRYGDDYAHRLVYAQSVGPIPAGYEIMHTCDNPACVNPDHLRAGTHAENMADSARKGRASRHGRSNWTMCRKKLHPLSGDNLYVNPRTGYRECLACKRERRREWGARNGR
jgi:hypothetical protein